MRRASSAVLLALPALACSELNTPIYFNGPATLELTGQEDPPRVTNTVTLRFRRPSDQERKELDARGDALGFEVPWVSRDKVHLELLYTVKNLDAQAGTFKVMVDGSNQYTKYDENVVSAAIAQGDEDEQVFLPLIHLEPRELAPGAVYQGTFREDDFDEGEADLDAMGRWMAPFASVLLNRSEVNPIGMEMVPPDVVTPAMMEVDVTFTADKHMTCEWMLRVRDDDDRLLHVEGDERFSPSPTLFTPMLPPTMP